MNVQTDLRAGGGFGVGIAVFLAVGLFGWGGGCHNSCDGPDT